MKIEKCPFCGGIGTLWSIDQCDTVYAVCQDCGARTVDYKHAEEAIAAWNSRTGKDINAATNADRIRSMSDEELAAMLYSFEDLTMPDYCQREKECEYMLASDIDIPAEKCIGCLIDWLKQPVKEE